MGDTGFFRTGFRGFNKDDVFAYLEKKEQEHAVELASLQQQAQQLLDENEKLLHSNQELQQQAQQAAEVALQAQQTVEMLGAENFRLSELVKQLQQAAQRVEQLEKANASLVTVVGDKATFAKRIEQTGNTYIEKSITFGRTSLEAMQKTMQQLQTQLDQYVQQADQLQQWLQQQTGDLTTTDVVPSKQDDTIKDFFRSAAQGRQA